MRVSAPCASAPRVQLRSRARQQQIQAPRRLVVSKALDIDFSDPDTMVSWSLSSPTPDRPSKTGSFAIA